MGLYDLIISRRSIRQFAPRPVGRDALERIVNAGRLAPSAANLQPLEFLIVDDEALRYKVFPCLKWAAYIHPAGDPKPGHEPAAYVFVLVNTKIREKMFEYDVGAAVENMAIAAAGDGVASCWLISFDRPKIAELFGIPEHYRLDSVLAVGYPAQVSKVEEFTDSPKYWQDADLTFHVPKRPLRAVVRFNTF